MPCRLWRVQQSCWEVSTSLSPAPFPLLCPSYTRFCCGHPFAHRATMSAFDACMLNMETLSHTDVARSAVLAAKAMVRRSAISSTLRSSLILIPSPIPVRIGCCKAGYFCYSTGCCPIGDIGCQGNSCCEPSQTCCSGGGCCDPGYVSKKTPVFLPDFLIYGWL